jgi:hypothetical protein
MRSAGRARSTAGAPGQPVSSSLTLHIERSGRPRPGDRVAEPGRPPLAAGPCACCGVVHRCSAPKRPANTSCTGHRGVSPRYDLASLGAGFAVMPLSGLQTGRWCRPGLSSPTAAGESRSRCGAGRVGLAIRKPVRWRNPGSGPRVGPGGSLRCRPNLADLRLMRARCRSHSCATTRLGADAGAHGMDGVGPPPMSRWQLRALLTAGVGCAWLAGNAFSAPSGSTK